MRSGIYLIRNINNNKCYIGSSNNLEYRKCMHFSKLKHNKHINQHLQNSYNKYGKESFIFTIIEECECMKEILLDREQYYINTMNPEYNILKIAGSTLGFNHSIETKLKISNSTIGIKKSKEHCENIKNSQKGKTLTDEHKQKLSESAKNRTKQGHTTKINIDGINYDSLKEASELLGIKYNTLQRRLVNPNFLNYIKL
jgi:group I intron endonuclease